LNEEILNILQQQARHLESCFNNPDLEDQEKAHLQELANSRKRTLEQLKEDIASYSQKLDILMLFELQHQQLMQHLGTGLEDEDSLSLGLFSLRLQIHSLLGDILDNYWDFFPVNYSKTLFRDLAYRISEIFLDSEDQYKQIVSVKENRKLSLYLKEFVRIIRKSLISTIDAALKVGALTKFEAARLRHDDLASDTRVEAENKITFQPKSSFGKKLWEIRQKIFAAGIPPLNSDEIEKEVADRRGGVMDE